MRHVKLRPGAAVDRAALAALIEAAYWRVKSEVRSTPLRELNRGGRAAAEGGRGMERRESPPPASGGR